MPLSKIVQNSIDSSEVLALSGIKFPATQVSSADANTLDDYEEGTFTPTIFGSSTAGTATYAQASGRYTKIGRLVQFELYLEYSSGTGTGYLRIGNLPFTVGNANTYPAISIGYLSLISLSANNVANGQCLPNTTNIAIEQYPAGGGSQNPVNYDASGGIVVSGTYSV